MQEWTVSEIEEAFARAEGAANTALKAASAVAAKARAMGKAAKQGNIGALRRAQADLGGTLAALGDEVTAAQAAWRWSPEEEEEYLKTGYSEELRAAAQAVELTLYEREDYLVAYPSLVRILPAERKVRVDRKALPTIRPSHLVNELLRRQQKRSGFAPARFLEALHSVYDEVAREAKGDLVGDGRVLPLARIYKLMTSLPGSQREYDRSDFARDIYTLDSDGPRTTRRGFTASFPSSTGMRKRAADIFSFVSPAGASISYYGIKFTPPA